MNRDRLLLNESGDNAETLLRDERLTQLHNSLPIAIISNIALSLILTYILEPAISATVLLGWFIVMMSVLSWRSFIFYQFTRKAALSSTKQLSSFQISTIATGLVWALVPALLFPENNIALQATLSFVLAGVSAGAASSLSMDKISSLGFIVPQLVSLTTAFLMEDGNESITMALMTAMFLGFVTFSCIRGERQFRENIYLRSLALQREKARYSSEARLRSLFDLSPFGIVLNDYVSGEILEVNDQLVSMTGYTKAEFININQKEITPKEYEAQEITQRKILIKAGRYGPYEKELIRKDGTRCPVVLNGVLIREDTRRKLVWSIVEDISDRKRVDKMKSEFISTVSHELRTPLTSISGALGLLASHFTGDWPEPMQKMLRIALSNSQRLTQLINDLLDIEKITSGKMDFKLARLPIFPLVEQAIENNKPYALNYGVKLVLQEDAVNPEVVVDPSRLQQILANFISNAIKFSPTDECVTVSIIETSNNTVRIKIADLGPGIPVNFHNRIFQKFSQADSSDTRAKGGTGLGLAITKELAERMNAYVGFDSIEGSGSTFWIELPKIST